MSDEQFSGATSTTESPDAVDVSPTASSSLSCSTSTSTCMYQRILLIVAIVVCLVLGVYFKHFHRLPIEDILAANLDRMDSDAEVPYYDDVMGDDDARRSQHDWEQWIRNNRFVSIGKLFDKCEGDDRVMLGRVVMLEDKVNGGVTSKTYLNLTLHKEIVGGLMYLTCQYNGNDLYSNHWDLCTVEDGQEDRVINCPIRVGRRKFVKELKIPNYLPKGRYTTKAWLLDQDKQMIGCAFADFTL